MLAELRDCRQGEAEEAQQGKDLPVAPGPGDPLGGDRGPVAPGGPEDEAEGDEGEQRTERPQHQAPDVGGEDVLIAPEGEHQARPTEEGVGGPKGSSRWPLSGTRPRPG